VGSATFIIFCAFIFNGVVPFNNSVWFAANFDVKTIVFAIWVLPYDLESTYYFVAASYNEMGSAMFIIFCAFIFNGVVPFNNSP